MAELTRRKFIAKAAAGAAAAGLMGSSEVRANPLGLPIGSQIYPHRQLLKDFPAYCKTMAEIGVQRLELCSPLGYGADFASLSDPKEVKKILADHGLKSESGHFTMRELREKQAESIEWAKEVGITQMITATLGGGSTPTMDDVKRAAEEYNKIAGAAAKAGIQQGLHNEGFELSEVDGKRTYDLLFELLDPKLVKFQFQMSTASRGFFAAEYFEKYPGRFISMHLQDLVLNPNAALAPAPPPAPGAAGGGRQGRGGPPQAALGKGSIDWVKTFKAAKKGGVKNYFVEQNLELTKESVAFLKTLKV
jgi:sugar phosphate isomerase/epimerase